MKSKSASRRDSEPVAAGGDTGKEAVLLVHLELEMRGRADDALKGTELLSHEARHFTQIIAADHYDEIVSAGHQPATHHLVKARDTVRDTVKAAAAFRGDLHFDHRH